MARRRRKYKSRITFYAVNDWRGKQVAERIGPNQREAALRDRTMKKEIKPAPTSRRCPWSRARPAAISRVGSKSARTLTRPTNGAW